MRFRPVVHKTERAFLSPCKISIDDFISGKEMKFDINVRITEKKYVKVSRSGENIAIERIRAYKNKGIHFLYMEKGAFSVYLDFNLTLAKAVTYVESGRINANKARVSRDTASSSRNADQNSVGLETR